MANKSVFASIRGKLLPRPDGRNREGAPAFVYTPRHRLAQLAVTGCLNGTFYAEAREQLAGVLDAAQAVDPAFVARTAVYARRHGFMKDAPALLLAYLTVNGPEFAAPVFDRVIDNGRMLRTFVQIMRSGAMGRKSLGSRPKRLVADWLIQASDDRLIAAAVGQDPSLADVIRMVHPTPVDPGREALFGYLIGKPHDAALLPEAIRRFEAFKTGETAEVPDVPFQMLTALPLGREAWAAIARNARWQTLRMNLNTFARHGVFEVEGMTALLAERLRDPHEIKRARVFPYQLMAARMATGSVPAAVLEALDAAMETAVRNVPAFAGRVAVCPDVSGSMASPVTGHRRGAATAVRCIDVAALVAAAVVRKNPSARVLPFENDVVKVRLDPEASVTANAAALAGIGGGGTNCSAPLRRLNDENATVDTVIFVSDNQSWVDAARPQNTETMRQWRMLKNANPEARLICVDIQPYGTTQAQGSADILNIGGFSDAVFEAMAAFATGETGPTYLVDRIEEIDLTD